ncbi:MAG: Flp pilus assembly protein CpaB [Planctomycetaceae bacterium]|nr:Flp pilus assembly protein CpaB [Planctomycetaceae bacterium]
MKLTPALLTMIMLLVIGGLVAAFIAKRMFAKEEVPVVDDRVTIPMALTDLKPGTVITDAHIGMGPALSDNLDREVLRTSRVVVGRVVRNPVERAQPIRTSDLYAPGERPPLEVTPGMRAISVSLSDGTALVDGLIEAGNYVDVHFTPSGNYSNRGGMVMTLFKGVKLLAINRSQTGSSSVDRGENSVTMELTPEQTNIMLLARDRGNINLTYTPSGLGNGGVAVADENRAFLDEVLGLTPPEKPKPPFQTEIFDGGSRRVNTFDLDGRASQGNGGLDNEFHDPPNTMEPGDVERTAPGNNGGYWGGRVSRDAGTVAPATGQGA